MKCVVLLLIVSHCIAIELQTGYGTVVGVDREESYEFLGIPFAQPPLGNLRFAPPEPWNPPTQNYIQNATTLQAACMQSNSLIYSFPGTPNEDCLYLNIYTPKSQNLPMENFPVMFWIHGGAFTGGSSTEAKYNGSVLAATHNVIVVSTNYRLGALGFLADPSFCSESPTCGMWGILDQQMAMQWVQQNIASFGGNPSKVTIFGESAGGMSVLVQLAQVETKGLFYQAIVESGIAEGYASLETAQQFGANLTHELGCIGVASCMRAEPAGNILAAQKNCKDPNCWWPVINNYNLARQPLDYLIGGNYNQVPVLFGCNSNEGYLFTLPYIPLRTEAKYERVLTELFGDFAQSVLEEYPVSEFDGSEFAALEAVLGDGLFVSQVSYVANAVTNHNTLSPNAYVYLFNHTPSYVPNAAGAFHGSELPFVFGFRDGFLHFTEEERYLSNNMTTFWTTFAKTGNPNPVGQTEVWKPYTNQTTDRIVLNTGEFSTIDAYRDQECEFWKQYYLRYYPSADVWFPFLLVERPKVP